MKQAQLLVWGRQSRSGQRGLASLRGEHRTQKGGHGNSVVTEKDNNEPMHEEQWGAEVSLPEKVTFALD